MYKQKHVHITATGGSASASCWVPPSRFAGMAYKFAPDHGTADIAVLHGGVNLLTKTDADNGDGIQELAPTAEKLVSGSVHISVNQIQAADEVDITLFFNF